MVLERISFPRPSIFDWKYDCSPGPVGLHPKAVAMPSGQNSLCFRTPGDESGRGAPGTKISERQSRRGELPTCL